MRIAWIADYTIKEHLGGAQHTNAKMIEYGRSLHQIVEISPKEFNPVEIRENFDLAIINNIMLFKIEDILRLEQMIPTVRYEHDREASRVYPQVYGFTIQNIFLSPLHKRVCEKNVGRELRGVCIPSPIDYQVFNKDGATNTKDTVIWVGSIEPHKGFDRFITYMTKHPKKKGYIVSFDYKEGELPANVEFVGEKHGEELAEWYRKCEVLYHHPQHEAFGRTVMEAYLCGCKLDLNENVGAMSYDWDYSNYQEVKDKLQSQKLFWETIFNL